jgi:hypothetical protein
MLPFFSNIFGNFASPFSEKNNKGRFFRRKKQIDDCSGPARIWLWRGGRNRQCNRLRGLEIKGALNGGYDLLVLRGRLFLILWIRLKGVVGPEYAPLITGASITRGNSGNGALPTRESERGRGQKQHRTISDARANR